MVVVIRQGEFSSVPLLPDPASAHLARSYKYSTIRPLSHSLSPSPALPACPLVFVDKKKKKPLMHSFTLSFGLYSDYYHPIRQTVLSSPDVETWHLVGAWNCIHRYIDICRYAYIWTAEKASIVLSYLCPVHR